MIVMMHFVDCRVAAAVPHFKALMALSDHSSHHHDSELANSDSSQSEVGDHSRAHRTDHVVVNYGPAKAKCVHQTFFLTRKCGVLYRHAGPTMDYISTTFGVDKL